MENYAKTQPHMLLVATPVACVIVWLTTWPIHDVPVWREWSMGAFISAFLTGFILVQMARVAYWQRKLTIEGGGP